MSQSPSGSVALHEGFASPPRAETAAADTPGVEERLLRARLGVSVSLFRALRSRHAGTAEHSFRVTVGCASWSEMIGLPLAERDALEVAALFHDIGKIGVPDQILLKPSRLTPAEAAIMERHRELGCEILRGSVAQANIMDILAAAPTWFDGRRAVAGQVGEYRSAASGNDLPLAARMLAIVDAFDAMTTAQVYRPALARDQALAELARQAGTQFDPELVRQFVELQGVDSRPLSQRVAGRWLRLVAEDIPVAEGLLASVPALRTTDRGDVFSNDLVDHLRDGVVFVDRGMQITYVNAAAEEITGHDAVQLRQQPFSPGLLRLRNERGVTLGDDQCPVANCLRSGRPQLQRLIVSGPSGLHAYVESQAVPVFDTRGDVLGATLILRDLASELSLEERCRNLQELATKDRLTLVANRAELDRAHGLLLAAHLARGQAYSLIVCDLDHFKQVNDRHGHQAGDEVLRSFARLLRTSCRQGDVVGRYGGEEFVVLCHECELAAASRLAEQIRRAWGDTSHPVLGEGRVTASFGIAQAKPGDTPESMFHRADKALLEAKSGGRNRVRLAECDEPVPDSATTQQAAGDRTLLVQETLWTNGPRSFTLDKIERFVAECGGDLTVNRRGELQFVVALPDGQSRRFTDRSVPFEFDLTPAEQLVQAPGGATLVRTRIAVAVRPERERDRRRGELASRARQLIGMLAEYLMAEREPA